MGRKTPVSKGCKIIRVTEAHDQTTEAGFQWLLDQISSIPKEKPILLWSSIPCTGGTKWVHYNLRRWPETFPSRLRKLRETWGKLIQTFYRLTDVIRKRNGFWVIEWPFTCEYWDVPHVRDFLGRQKEVFDATAAGCAFNLRAIDSRDCGRLMSKSWHIKTNVKCVREYLHRPCSCPSNYKHAQAQGQNTAWSGRYTTEFVSSVHRMFSYAVSKQFVERTARSTHR